jgi:hypothetical protein
VYHTKLSLGQGLAPYVAHSCGAFPQTISNSFACSHLHLHKNLLYQGKKSPLEKFGFASFFFSEAMNIFQNICLDYHLLGDREAAVCTNKFCIYSTVSVWCYLKSQLPRCFSN